MDAHKHDGDLSLERGETHAHHHLGHAGNNRALIGALLLTLGFAVVEAAAGWWSGSLALLSDAAHMLTDASSLGLAAAAAWLARRPPSLQHSYGLVRAEILSALVNSLAMLALVGFIVYEAIQRFGAVRPIAGGTVMVVATLGLFVNLLVAWMLHRGEQTLNSRAALLHVLGDALGSIAAIGAGTVIYFTGWLPIDPILSIVVSMLILFSAFTLLREVLHVLMEGVPLHIDLNQVGHDLSHIAGVLRVHDLHVWTLSSGTVALSAHLEIHSLADWPTILAEARALMDARHHIHHTTLQPETLASAPLHFHASRPDAP